MENNQGFRYSYSAEQQQEVRRIRSKYQPEPEDGLVRLRRLDAGVSKTASAAALALGIFGTLLLGVGLCCTTVWSARWLVPGILTGVCGLAGICLAYPLYRWLLDRMRKKLAPEIIRLTDELLK